MRRPLALHVALVLSLPVLFADCAVTAKPEPELEPAGTECGAITCEPTEFCDWPADDCGSSAKDGGRCMPRPEVCQDEGNPTCGCDGEVHGNPCYAHSSGTDIQAFDFCSDTHASPCGSESCTLAQYCEHVPSDTPPDPDSWQCLPLPAVCIEAPTCDCLEQETCAETCEGTAEKGLSVLCPGG